MYNMGMMRRLPSDSVFSSMDSPVGTLTLIVSGRGLHALLFEVETSTCREGLKRFTDDDNHPVLRLSKEQLSQYFAGARRQFDLRLAMEGTGFQRCVWNLLQQIPYGTTATYGDLARKVGGIRQARAVGAANAVNPIAVIVPCHRVIGQNGALTGFGGGLGIKGFLLDLERQVSLGAHPVAATNRIPRKAEVAAVRTSSDWSRPAP